MSQNFCTTIELNEIETKIEVEYSYYSGEKPSRYSPGDSADLEVLSVVNESGKAVKLSEKEMDSLIEDCLRDVAENIRDGLEAQAEAQLENARDNEDY